MVGKERIKEVVRVLKPAGRLQRNQLVRKIVEEGLMSHQTASDAIDEAVKSHTIFRQEDYKGKQKIVWLSIFQDMEKIEHSLLEELEKKIQEFDLKFGIYKDKFRKLSTEEKAEGADVFHFLFRNIVVVVEQLEWVFGKTRRWSDFLKKVRKRQDEFIKLASLVSPEVQVQISHHMLTQNMMDVEDAFDEADDYLEEVIEPLNYDVR